MELLRAVEEVCEISACSVELYGDRLSLSSAKGESLKAQLEGSEPTAYSFELRSDGLKLGELQTSALDPMQETLLRVLLHQASSRLALLGPVRNYREFFQLSLDLLSVADGEGYFRILNPR